MFEWLSISTEDLVVRHSPEILGIFEPLSRLIFVNITTDQLSAGLAPEAGDVAALTVNDLVYHEIHHYYQTFCTGYLYRQCRELVTARGAAAGWWRSPDIRALVLERLHTRVSNRLRAARRFRLSRDLQAFERAFDELLAQERHVAAVERIAAAHGERTRAGVLSPGLHTALEEVRAKSARRGPQGLSAQDVYEGSSFIFGKLAAHGTDFAGHLDDGPPVADSMYRRLWEYSRDRVGDSVTPTAVLLAAAVALCHEEPGQAFGPVLDCVAHVAVGEELAQARIVAGQRSRVAGTDWLGTAWDVDRNRLRPARRTKTYARQIRAIHTRAWDDLDEWELLSDPVGLSRIPVGALGFAFVTLDGQAGNPKHFPARLLVGTDMLRSGPSVAGMRREMMRSWADAEPAFAALTARLFGLAGNDG